MAISLDKIEELAPGLVPTARTAIDVIAERGLTGQPAKVAVCLDYSISMQGLYASGVVQEITERALALGTQFDDDGDIDVYAFESRAHYLGTLNLTNYRGGVDRLLKGRSMGSTDYAGAMRLVRSKSVARKGLFSRKAATAALPTYVLFVTDGEPNSRPDAVRELTEASREPIFWQFLGLGTKNQLKFLTELDTLQGRLLDNANAMFVPDVRKVDDITLITDMLGEYPDWLPQARRHNLVS